jgi:hypothetical protein
MNGIGKLEIGKKYLITFNFIGEPLLLDNCSYKIGTYYEDDYGSPLYNKYFIVKGYNRKITLLEVGKVREIPND